MYLDHIYHPPLPWDFRNTFSFYIDVIILIFYLSLTELNQSFPPETGAVSSSLQSPSLLPTFVLEF